jgi:hypothetical protein
MPAGDVIGGRRRVVTLETLNALIDGRRCDDRGAMERALLAVSWHTHVVARELARLNIENVVVNPGNRIYLVVGNRRYTVPFEESPYSPGYALFDWLTRTSHTTGALFHLFRYDDHRRVPPKPRRLTEASIRAFFLSAAKGIGVPLIGWELVQVEPGQLAEG